MRCKHVLISAALIAILIVPLYSRADIPPAPQIIDVQQVEQTSCVIFCTSFEYWDPFVRFDRLQGQEQVTIAERDLSESEAVGQAGNWGYSVFVQPDVCVPAGLWTYKFIFQESPDATCEGGLEQNCSTFDANIYDSFYDCTTQSPSLCENVPIPPTEYFCYNSSLDDDFDDESDDVDDDFDDNVDDNLDDGADDELNGDDADNAGDDSSGADKDAMSKNSSKSNSSGGCSTAGDPGAGSLALAVGMFIAGLIFVKVTGRKKD